MLRNPLLASFYQDIEQLYRASKQITAPDPIYFLYYAGVAQFVIRFWISTVCVQQSRHSEYFQYDLIFNMILSAGANEPLLYLTCSTIWVYFGYSHVKIYLDSNGKVWNQMQHIICENYIDFRASLLLQHSLNIETFNPKQLLLRRIPLVSMRRFIRVCRDIWSDRLRVQFSRNYYDYQNHSHSFVQPFVSNGNCFVELTHQHRARLVLIWLAIEVANVFILCLIMTVLSLLFTFSYLPSFPRTSSIQTILSIIDFIVYALMGMYSIRTTVFFETIIIVFSIAFTFEYRKLNRIMRLFVRQSRHRKVLDQFRCGRALATYRAWHARLCRFAMHLNATLISQFFFAFLMCNVMFNACTIMFMYYKKFEPFFRIFLIFLLTVQIVIPLAAFVFIIPVNYVMYGSNKSLYSVLARFRPVFYNAVLNREQWKAATYYEMLNQPKKRPLVMTAGPLGTLNRRSTYKFVLIYAAFLMHFGSKFINVGMFVK